MGYRPPASDGSPVRRSRGHGSRGSGVGRLAGRVRPTNLARCRLLLQDHRTRRVYEELTPVHGTLDAARPHQLEAFEYRIDAVRGALPVLAGVAAGRVRRSGPTPTVPITAAAFLMPICWNLTLRCTGATDTFSDLPFPVSWQDTVTGVRPRRCPDRPEPRVCGKEHRPPRRTAGPVGGARRCPHRHLHLLT